VPVSQAMNGIPPHILPPTIPGMTMPGPPMQPGYPPGMYVPPQQTLHVPREEEQEMSLKDMLDFGLKVMRFFKPYWGSICVLVIFGLCGGLVSYMLLPPPSKAVFQMTLEQKASENELGVFQRSNIAFF